MRRISTTTKVTDKFGSGKHGFTNGDAVGGVPATDLEDVWFDHAQEEICAPIEAAGLTLDPNNRGQLLEAIQILSAPIVGLVRNAKMSVTAASASATFTADQVVVASATGGKHYRLAGFNKTINLATTGVGGMDTGSPPNNGFVALYAIFNPSTGSSSILAKDATSVAGTNVYSGANLPAGYTASALIGLWPTDGTGKFKAALQIDRQVSFPAVTALNTAVAAGSFTSLGISSIVPKGARSVSGYLAVGNTSFNSQATVLTVAADANGSGGKQIQGAMTSASGSGFNAPFDNLSIGTDQAIYYQATTTTGTPTFIVALSGYQF